MITWVTVWVLTVTNTSTHKSTTYQLSYESQSTCLLQAKKHREIYIDGYYKNLGQKARCDFQQIPMVTK